MWQWLKSLIVLGDRTLSAGKSGREILLPGQYPPKRCSSCGSSRLMLAEDIEVGSGTQHVRDVVFCEVCGREWELAPGHQHGSNPRQPPKGAKWEDDLNEIFAHSAVVQRAGGALMIDSLENGPRKVIELVQAPVEAYLDGLQGLRNRTTNATPRWHHGYIRAHRVNAVAFEEHYTNFIGINAGTISCLFATSMALFSLPSFLPDFGDASLCAHDNISIDRSRTLLRSVLAEGELDWRLQFDFPKDKTRTDFALALFLMAAKFVFFHELGHLIDGHIELLRTKTGKAELVELRPIGNGFPTRNLSHMMEIDADDFAAGHYTTVLSAAQKEGAHTLGKGIQTLETMNLMWTLAAGIIFRIFARGLTIDPISDVYNRSNSHPHPALRLALVRQAIASHRFHEPFIPQSNLDAVLVQAEEALNRTLEDIGATPIWTSEILSGSLIEDTREKQAAFIQMVLPHSFEEP